MKLRRHQRVRLGVTVKPRPGGATPWNATSHCAPYFAVFVAGGQIQWRASHKGGPPFWLQSVVVEAGVGVGHPRMVEEWRRRLVLVYERTGGQSVDVMALRSSDQGRTWTEAEVMIAGGKKPTIGRSLDGTLIFCAVVGNTIHGRIQYPGDLVPREEFTFQAITDDTRADMLVQDDTFQIDQEWGPHARYWLHVLLEAETATSHWYSADRGRTWRRGSLPP